MLLILPMDAYKTINFLLSDKEKRIVTQVGFLTLMDNLTLVIFGQQATYVQAFFRYPDCVVEAIQSNKMTSDSVSRVL